MPQMSPIMWTFLFFIFNSTLILMMVINYYNFLYFPTSNLKKSTFTYKQIWKW